MNGFLTLLTRRTVTPWMRYGIVAAVVGFITVFRIVVPLDTAPFLLYMPAVFLLSVAFGKRAGYFGTAMSMVAAASFFEHADAAWWALTIHQWVALLEYVLVSTAMVWACGALRQLIFDNEASLTRLHASEVDLRTIVDTVPVGIMFAEAGTGRIVRRNKRMSRIVGASGEPSKSMEEYGSWRAFHADGRSVEAGEYPLSRVLKNEAAEAELQVHYQRKDGSRVWIDLVATATRNARGDITGAVVAVSDIDVRKQAEAAKDLLTAELLRRKEEAEVARKEAEAAKEVAEAANRTKSTFIANMSHELRTPLSAIIGYAEMISEEIDDGTTAPDLAQDVQKIETNARHLLGLINDVLDLSKVESGKMEAFVETFDVAEMAEGVASTVGALMAKKSNRFELRLAPDLGSMDSDVTRIRQVLLNLLSNAAKFCETGTITLSITRHLNNDRASFVRFAVEDTGIGMTEEQLAKLFQRFQQADASTTRQFGGTGLGLALTKAFAKLLGGEVEVRSEHGKGSTFVVEVPADLRKGGTAEGSKEQVVRSHERDDARDVVLVIDDDQTQRDLVSRFLEREGYAARTAADGPSGLDLARRLRPHLILLDVTMPGMDGWSVLSKLKSDPDLAATPVIMVTFVSERALASSLGAADYVMKPVDWNRLRHVMEGFRDCVGDVLIVDDEADMRSLARHSLEKNGWSVVEAANGVEALEKVELSIPRVILLDLTMPVMDGFAFLRELRGRAGCSGIPVVVLTALDLTSEDRRQLRGATQILHKGDLRMNDLVERLTALREHPR